MPPALGCYWPSAALAQLQGSDASPNPWPAPDIDFNDKVVAIFTSGGDAPGVCRRLCNMLLSGVVICELLFPGSSSWWCRGVLMC